MHIYASTHSYAQIRIYAQIRTHASTQTYAHTHRRTHTRMVKIFSPKWSIAHYSGRLLWCPQNATVKALDNCSRLMVHRLSAVTVDPSLKPQAWILDMCPILDKILDNGVFFLLSPMRAFVIVIASVQPTCDDEMKKRLSFRRIAAPISSLPALLNNILQHTGTSSSCHRMIPIVSVIKYNRYRTLRASVMEHIYLSTLWRYNEVWTSWNGMGMGKR